MRNAAAPGEPLHLEVLGHIGLWAGTGGDELRSVLVQPKRFALLVYVALRHPDGFVRRDELLGAFWADSSGARGRAALRQALRFLRRRLGPEVLVNRGDAEVGVGPGTLECDALKLVDALDRQEDEVAVELYKGDLLPGFLLEDAWEFDRWLQAERQRLRAGGVGAALRLADRAEDAGEVAEAAERVRWAQRLEPTDEAVGRRLISLLARSGNRSRAVAAYEALEARLKKELDLEPSPETRELLAAIRDAPADTSALTTFGGADRTLTPQRVLVLELENLTGDGSLDVISRLAADTLAQGLATIPDLEVVPPLAAGAAPAPEEEREMAALAHRTRAGTVLTGSFHVEKGDLWFQVRITDVVGGRVLPGPDPVRTDRSAPLDGVERLRDGVMTTLAPILSRRIVHVRRAARPPGIPAFRAYLEGLDQFIRRAWGPALEHFGRSIELEPDYALPRIVRSIALWNLGELQEAQVSATEAHDLRDALGPFERAVLDMVQAWLVGDWAAARRASIAQAEIAPGSIPHFQVAEEARRLNRPRETRELLGRLDPEAGELRGWIFYWVELATAHHLLGDHVRELEVASRCRRLHPDDPAAVLLEIRALAALGRETAVERLVDQALTRPASRHPLPGELLIEAALELRAHGRSEAAAPLLDRAVEWYREHIATAGDTPSLRRDLARALYHAGRFGEAREGFRELVRTSEGRVQSIRYHHGHLQAHLDEGYMAVLAVREGDQAAARRWSTFLRDLDEPFLYGAQWFWLAAVAALEDDEKQSTRMLRRAFADGMPMELFLHTDPHIVF